MLKIISSYEDLFYITKTKTKKRVIIILLYAIDNLSKKTV